MKTRLFSILAAAAVLCLRAAGAETAPALTLEHEFEGYYSPLNFPVYTEADDDRYFYSPLISAEGNTLSLMTYNEDYSIRDDYQVTYAVPDGYKPGSVSFSPSMRINGEVPCFIVSFTATATNYGEPGYAKAQAFDARDGSLLFDLGTASQTINMMGPIYKINDKPSIVILYFDYHREGTSAATTYRTRVYSLGESKTSSDETAAAAARPAAPIRTYDLSGRLIEAPLPGQPHILLYGDGSAEKAVR